MVQELIIDASLLMTDGSLKMIREEIFLRDILLRDDWHYFEMNCSEREHGEEKNGEI